MDLAMQQAPGSIATRFSSGYRPPANGRTCTKWLRDRLNKVSKPNGDKTAREEILDHLIEVATSWEVRVIGKDRDGELLKVASGRDSVEAAKLLLGYDMGQVKRPESPLEIANHLLAVAKLQVDIALGIIGKRADTMAPEQLKAYLLEFAKDQNPAAFFEAAKAMQAQEQAEQQPPATAVEGEPKP